MGKKARSKTIKQKRNWDPPTLQSKPTQRGRPRLKGHWEGPFSIQNLTQARFIGEKSRQIENRKSLSFKDFR
jgi:hypothetical protein